MKIAVLSDVHGNVPALEAVLEDLEAWQPDDVIVNGDLINRGPYSLAVLRLLEQRVPGCRFLKGNHESYVLRIAEMLADPESPGHDLDRFARWTADQMGEALERIARWADHLDLTDLPGGASFHVTHGSRLGNRDGIHPETDESRLAEKIGDPRDLFIGSHTHRPLLRRFQGNLVVNTGSVGQPLDGDPRASYGRFCLHGGQWTAEIARVSFDRDRARRDFHDSGFLEAGGPLATLIHKEVCEARMHVAPWRRRYLDAVKRGELSLGESVARYLREA